MTLVLASSSAARQTMLRQAGVSFVVQPAQIDEESVLRSLQAEGAKPHDIADALAEFKARRAVQKASGATILAADQVLDLKGRLFMKPQSRDDAAESLIALQGQTHQLLSAAVIYHEAEPIWRHVGQARLTMHAMTMTDINAYLDVAWPDAQNSVGAYHAEGYGARLFSRIDGDWYSVLGLPLLNVLSFLRLRGWLTP